MSVGAIHGSTPVEHKITYKVSAKLVYVEDYQSEHYRALILDSQNSRAKTGNECFVSEKDAIAD